MRTLGEVRGDRLPSERRVELRVQSRAIEGLARRAERGVQGGEQWRVGLLLGRPLREQRRPQNHLLGEDVLRKGVDHLAGERRRLLEQLLELYAREREADHVLRAAYGCIIRLVAQQMERADGGLGALRAEVLMLMLALLEPRPCD